MVAHDSNARTRQAGGSWVQGHLGLRRLSLSQETQEQEEREGLTNIIPFQRTNSGFYMIVFLY